MHTKRFDFNKKQRSYALGHDAEQAACSYLIRHGYTILQQRYKTKYGEIDIIAQHGDMIVFVEVKARARLADALEAVTERTRRRIENAAQYYISQYEDVADYALRFDVIAVQVVHSTAPLSIEHLDNAWYFGA